MNIEQLGRDLLITCFRVFTWTSLSWVIGVLIGFGMYKSSALSRMMHPVINLFRHISPFCWLPLIIIIGGIGEVSVGLVLLLAMVFNAMILSMETFRALPRTLLEQAELDGADYAHKFRFIELPLAMGGIVNLYRVLWSVGWTTVVAAEMLGVDSGMGYRLLDYRYLLQYKEMLVYILIIGVIGIITDVLILKIRERYFPVYHS